MTDAVVQLKLLLWRVAEWLYGDRRRAIHHIACSDLASAVGYPYGHAAAERVLAAAGWHYDISGDAWVRRNREPRT